MRLCLVSNVTEKGMIGSVLFNSRVSPVFLLNENLNHIFMDESISHDKIYRQRF